MQLRVLAFGDPADGSWGVAWVPAQADQASLLGAALGEQGTAPQLDGERAEEAWRLTAGGTELTLDGRGEPAPDPEGSGFDQLCQVSGTLQGPSGRREVRCPGWRSVRPQISGRLDSLRQVVAWFEPDEGFAVLAARPEGRGGQERDQVTAALFDPAGAKAVADPRLSTTYDGSDQPMRASVELWIEVDGDSETQYPRRAIGEAVAPPAEGRAGGLALQGRPFRWYSGGMEGGGIYLIARPA